MRLYSGKVPAIATEVVRTLLAANDIEAERPKEVEADIAAVLNQYLADEREVNERAKDVLERTGKSQTDFQRVRQLVADEKGIKVGDDALDYLLDQVVEMLMHSGNVDEVYVEDVDLRRKMAPVLQEAHGGRFGLGLRRPRPAQARSGRDARMGDRIRARPRASEAAQRALAVAQPSAWEVVTAPTSPETNSGAPREIGVPSEDPCAA